MAGIAMRPSDATMESAMLRRRFIQYEDHDPFFQTAVNRRGATWSETDVRKLRKVKSYKIKRSEAETKRLKALKIRFDTRSEIFQDSRHSQVFFNRPSAVLMGTHI